MADAVASQVIQDGERLFIGTYTNISDGTGETAAVKINVSALNPNSFGSPCNGVKINKIWVQTINMALDLLWDATTDVLCESFPSNVLYEMRYHEFGGLPNNAGAGNTGNVLFTTVGATAGSRYTIIIEAIKTYAA